MNPCVMKSIDDNRRGVVTSWKFPADAQAHYDELLVKTRVFRDVPVHSTNDYKGPWYEFVG
jgi:hypothetical protein